MNSKAVWTKAKLAEANRLRRFVLGGANPFTATNFNMADQFDKYRKELGAEKVNEFLAKFGLGPNYTPAERKKYICPDCKKQAAFLREVHPDTDLNAMELYCPACGHSHET